MCLFFLFCTFQKIYPWGRLFVRSNVFLRLFSLLPPSDRVHIQMNGLSVRPGRILVRFLRRSDVLSFVGVIRHVPEGQRRRNVYPSLVVTFRGERVRVNVFRMDVRLFRCQNSLLFPIFKFNGLCTRLFDRLVSYRRVGEDLVLNNLVLSRMGRLKGFRVRVTMATKRTAMVLGFRRIVRQRRRVLCLQTCRYQMRPFH